MHVILAINVGSSSLKFALYTTGAGLPYAVAHGSYKNIGSGQCTFEHSTGTATGTQQLQLTGVAEALKHLQNWLSGAVNLPVTCVVHRLVHGGPTLHQPCVIDAGVLSALKTWTALAPDHLPPAIEAIEAAQQLYPQAIPVACFDTAFHWYMPPVAKTLPVDAKQIPEDIHKYGFHGLSYEYVYAELATMYTDIAEKKILLAHLGNGASMCAVKNGTSIDTTMGLTPSGGLLMGTRSGDIDPGILLYLLQHGGHTADTLQNLINHHSGLKGISGLSSDMDVLLQNMAHKPAAKLAVDMFCYQATKHAGALIAAMGGIDIVAFTGGIGFAAPVIRTAICAPLGFAGIQLDAANNQQNCPVISATDSAVTVYVVNTDEEIQMAKHAIKLLIKNNL